MPIRVTRRLVAAALDGSLQRADFRTDPYFGLAVPAQVPGVEPHILEPIKTWRSKAEFAEVAGRVVQMFRDNFKRVETHADQRVRAAGPTPRIALACGGKFSLGGKLMRGSTIAPTKSASSRPCGPRPVRPPTPQEGVANAVLKYIL